MRLGARNEQQQVFVREMTRKKRVQDRYARSLKRTAQEELAVQKYHRKMRSFG